jgi:hypothetical protein
VAIQLHVGELQEELTFRLSEHLRGRLAGRLHVQTLALARDGDDEAGEIS